ncbi:MAG: TRAP transporter small permease subunit [Proteobacteria bacterium]|nr:TRAP transporter small permease subunit [Pseudomonadota bacterium]
MEKLAQYLSVLPHAGHFVGRWLLLLLAFVIGYDVVGRKFFYTGSIVLQDLEWHLHGAAVMLGFGAAYLKDAHVRVDLVREKFKPSGKLKLEIFGIIVFMIPYLGMLAYFSVDYALRSYVTNEGPVGGTGLDHRWIIKSFLTIGLGLLILSACSVLSRCIVCLRAQAQECSPFEPLV